MTSACTLDIEYRSFRYTHRNQAFSALLYPNIQHRQAQTIAEHQRVGQRNYYSQSHSATSFALTLACTLDTEYRPLRYSHQDRAISARFYDYYLGFSLLRTCFSIATCVRLECVPALIRYCLGEQAFS